MCDFIKEKSKEELENEFNDYVHQTKAANSGANRNSNPNPKGQFLIGEPKHPRVLAIRGPSNSGKSSSIYLALHNLIHRLTPTYPGNPHPPQGLKTEFFYMGTVDNKEVTAILTIDYCIYKANASVEPDRIGKLGIATRGDNEDVINDTLNLFFWERCDAVIVACRTKTKQKSKDQWNGTFMQHPFIQSAFKNNRLTCFEFSKAKPSKHDEVNKKRAEKITKWV